jgi:hypothetical protein
MPKSLKCVSDGPLERAWNAVKKKKGEPQAAKLKKDKEDDTSHAVSVWVDIGSDVMFALT